VVVETVQAEGGVNVARVEWLQWIETLCRRFDMLLIVDDVQVGCGRTGTFFSFERAGLYPDIVVLSKAISGFGLPMSLVLLKPDLDVWESGEYTGTFRGNNLAFITATAALDHWRNGELTGIIAARSTLLSQELAAVANDYPQLQPRIRGVGLIFGLELAPTGLAQRIAEESFNRGVIVELCGARRNVIKFLPPLLIEPSVLQEGLQRLRDSIESIVPPSSTVHACG
jgi:diaminobutyrate-2-oxoglutarate transaminase